MSLAFVSGHLHRNDLVIGVIEGRPDEIIHRRILNDEIIPVVLLHIDHARHQNAGIAGNHAAGLEDIFQAEMAKRALHHGGIFIGMGRHVIGAAIGHAKAAAQIEMANIVAFRFQPCR